MGLAAAGTVLIAVLIALTLLPAVLGMLKSKAFGGQVRKYAPAHEADGRSSTTACAGRRLVGKRPLAAVLLVVVALGALAIPLKDLHLAFPTDSTASSDTTQRKASDLLSEAFGPGREGPLLVVVDARGAADARQRLRRGRRLGQRPGRRRQRPGRRHQRRPERPGRRGHRRAAAGPARGRARRRGHQGPA